ncbi:MAG: saccharopine dehydrogenase NADP-binding domain-containing protein [Candidatus Rokubacteria bacterium]|nr:saccharopine dehydrogenase NADP-binding domain-containing protein [Candidatus Rokubacteria bacterium]
MRLLVLGSGLMGPAAAFHAMADPDVREVVVSDASEAQLEACRKKLAGRPGAEKLATFPLDLGDRAAAVKRLTGARVAVAALPNTVSPLAIRAATEARVPLVDLTRPPAEALPDLEREAAARRGLVVLGCGLEPGLTEIMARHLAEKLDRVDELHMTCGGIPERPTGPLGYKIVFGAGRLPLRETDALVVEDGRLRPVPRYSGVERLVFPGVGECEAWHEGFMPWLLDLPALKGLRAGTQKTVRWPGYAAKVSVLRELGLLSLTPVAVDGVEVVPKRVVDAVVAPRLRLEEGERDIAVLRVEVLGEKDGRPRRYRVEMVDRYDAMTGFTAMARTTAFTATSVARMIARGELMGTGILTPERLLVGTALERLVRELGGLGIRFDFGEER